METTFFRAGGMITRFWAVQSDMILKIFQYPDAWGAIRISGKRYFLHVVAC